jgi:hypothetical protein
MNPALDRPSKESHEFQNVLIQTCELILPHNQFFTLRCTTYTSRSKSPSRGTRPCLADWRQEGKHQSHQEFNSGLKTKVMHHPRLVQLTVLLPYNEFILTRFQPTPLPHRPPSPTDPHLQLWTPPRPSQHPNLSVPSSAVQKSSRKIKITSRNSAQTRQSYNTDD